MRTTRTSAIILTGLFAALVCAATLLVQIPIPATGGYANLGDGVILTAAFLLHPGLAAIAAGVGSALADVILGYVAYAPGTFIIKAGVALIAALLSRAMARRKKDKTIPALATAAIAAEGWMVLGYLIYEAALLGAGLGALGGVMGNIGQGAVGVLVACAVTPVVQKARVLTKWTGT